MSILNNIDFDSKETTTDTKQYLMMRLDGELLGISVDYVEDILSPQEITPIPLAPPEVKGALNLRGRIVTAINMRAKLGMDNPDRELVNYRSVVIKSGNDLYSIILDSVSEVINVADSDIDRIPDNLSEEWKDVSSGVFSMEDDLMVILDTAKLLNLNDNEEDEA